MEEDKIVNAEEQDKADLDEAAKKAEEEKQIEEARQKALEAAEHAVEISSHGRLELAAPIANGDHNVDALEFDFLKLTGMELADAMDEASTGLERGIDFNITKKQAFNLFCVAAGKCTNNRLFPKEIKERMGARDVINAIRTAQLFFVASVQAENLRSSKASSK